MNLIQKVGIASLLLGSTVSIDADTLLGAYSGNQGWAMEDSVELEQWQGKKHAVINLYSNWSPTARDLLFRYQLNNIWRHGSVPMITWEPTIGNETPEDIETQIANGHYDDYIQSWGTLLKQFLSGMDGQYDTDDDRRVFIRLAHEPNGTWYPWSASSTNTPDDYIAMWQRTHQQLRDIGLDSTHVQWVWTVNNVDIGEYSAEQYYPGDAYVDWLGIDGFNWGTDYSWSRWQSPPEIFEPMRHRLDQLAPNKPVALPEVASTSGNTFGTDNFAKDAWIEQLAQYIQDADIRMMSWFNQDKESDWQVFGGKNGAEELDGVMTYPAYQQAMGEDYWITGGHTHPRILSDAQFQGDFSNKASNPPNHQSCQVYYHVSSQWDGGYVAKLNVSANYLIPQNWQLDWEFPQQQLAYGWDAVLQQTENTLTATPPSWWKWVSATSTPSFGYVGRGVPASPTHASLNGISCTVIGQ